MNRMTAPLGLASLLSLFLLACTAAVVEPDLLPPLKALEPGQKAQLLRARTAGIRTLTAVLTIEFSGFERQGTFDLIVNYADSGHLRFSAFKDMFVTTRPVFDLLLTDKTYRLAFYEAGQARQDRGDVSQFVQQHPQFGAFFTVGEAFFLPGFDAAGRLPVPTDAAASQFVTRLKSGALAHWSTKAATLEITSARIQMLSIQYGQYRQIGPYYMPGLVILTDPSQGITSRGLLRHADINTPLAPGVFDMSSVPKRPGQRAFPVVSLTSSRHPARRQVTP
jgi:hypothetical protein